MIRLDKYLVEMSIGSRSQIKEMAKKGRITINGEVVKATDTKLDENNDIVAVDGSPVAYKAYEYYMLNKPAGVISATEDRHTKTVIDLITDKSRNDLFPVGRLDKDTEGLLLITNDGDLTHRLLSPKKHVDKVYYAKVAGIVTSEHIKQFAEGLTLTDGTKVLPGELEIISVDETCVTELMMDVSAGETTKTQLKGLSEITLTIHEGKFHQVKRMFEAVGTKVIYLKRLSMGFLKLDEALLLGEYRSLTEDEINKLKELY